MDKGYISSFVYYPCKALWTTIFLKVFIVRQQSFKRMQQIIFSILGPVYTTMLWINAKDNICNFRYVSNRLHKNYKV